MTVRWKPLLVLSGLFAIIAVVGVVAMAYLLMPRGSGDILPLAQADRKAKQYDKALIHYKRALQKDGRNPSIHEELAAMYGEWAAQAPADLTPEKKAEIQYGRIESLIAAAKYGKTLKEPRRLLLADAMARDASSDSIAWAKELLALEPKNADAHYVLAAEPLEAPGPNIPDVKRHLAELEAAKAPAVRIAWVKARLAQQTGDTSAVEDVLARCRALTLAADAGPVDRMALVRLRTLDVLTTADREQLSGRVQALQAEARPLLSGPPLAPARIRNLIQLLEGVQKSLTLAASNGDPKSKEALNGLVTAIDADVESLFQKALDPASRPDLQVYLTYADHLRFRQKREECLRVVDQALKAPAAARPAASETVMGLHAVAVEAALGNVEDKERFQKSEPHLKKLIECAFPRYQGLGHLFQGAIDLESSGVGRSGSGDSGAAQPPSAAQLKLRASALGHLKVAANLLPDVAEAQARYGVALVLAMEQGLGRQYLQKALATGTLDPQYQIWAAWSMVQAGYPEEAEPIVTHLLGQVAQGRQPRELETTLHLLNGEIHQARRSPDDLKRALAEYEKSTVAGEAPAAAVQLRLAQIEVQLGQHDRALKRIDALRKQGQGGPAAEHLAVLTLQEQGKAAEARAALDEARRRFPASDELVGLDAAMLARAEKPKEADRVLAEFLRRDPDNVGITLMRAQLLADLLDDADQARQLLVAIADRSDNSGPLVQLALLQLKQHEHAAMAATIAKIRARWKEAAMPDLLDAQLSLDQNDLSSAVAHFDAALKKDPGNKLVQFWKAQLDSRNGATKDARESLESIARARPSKEIDTGQSLMAAAESALAGIALDNGDLDSAIQRLEDLRSKARGGVGGLTRNDRWQLVRAYSTKGQWPSARREIASLLNDPKTQATHDERVRGATYYRLHDEADAALAQLDYVIRVDPAHPAAVVTRASILTDQKKFADASALLRRAIDASAKKDATPGVFYLMLAAIETLTPPEADAWTRALAILDQGLELHPVDLELVKGKYRVLRKLKGDKEAIAFIESKAAAPSKARTDLRRLLVETYHAHDDLAGAERVLRGMLQENPKDSEAAANLVRVVAMQAVEASRQGSPDRERSLNDVIAGMIRDFRARFPNDVAFLEAECDLAARRGDLARATSITQEMDKLAKSSPSGPLTRARIYSAQGRLREAAEAYAEALDRNPRQYKLRVVLGQIYLKLGEPDEAIRQARFLLDIDKDQPDAVLLQAQALAAKPGPDAQRAANRSQAIEGLAAAIRKDAKFSEAYHLAARLQVEQGDRARAAATLKDALKANPEDAAGIAQLVQLLAEPREAGRPASAAELGDAAAIAARAAEADKTGSLLLAVAVGYHKAGQLELALPWAEKAAAKLDEPVVHLNYGDLLLSIAERDRDTESAKGFFRRAVEQYDLVLKAQPNSVEAVNNKAWILHSYLGQSAGALELALGLLKRVDPATLPGEFYDTLGAIQEATGRARDAEDSYAKGLRKSPDHPVLNFHMARLMTADRRRAAKANAYLEKANAGRGRLSAEMSKDLDSMIQKLGLRAN